MRKNETCECGSGKPATEVVYKRGSSDEIWMCASKAHAPRVQELSAQGWMSQSSNAAASAVGAMIRRRMQQAS